MADQVTPAGGLAPGLPLTILVATAKPQQVPERPRPSRPVEPQPVLREEGDGEASGPALESAVKAFEAFLQQSRSDLQFQVDESTGRTYFKVVDSKTQEVIRQVPSEEILAMARKLRELVDPRDASGVLMDREG